MRKFHLSRKKQIVIYVFIMVLAFCWYASPLKQKYSSPEDVLYACEVGLHYGPSKKIEHIKYDGRRALVIGRLHAGLSLVPAEKNWYGRWTLEGGASVYGRVKIATNDAVFEENYDIIIGLCDNSNIKKVEVTLGSYEQGDIIEYGRYTTKVEADGFFYIDVMNFDYDKQKNFVHVVGVEGFDEKGNSITYNNIVGEE